MVACMGSSTIRISRRELGPTHEVVFNIHYNSFFCGGLEKEDGINPYNLPSKSPRYHCCKFRAMSLAVCKYVFPCQLDDCRCLLVINLAIRWLYNNRRVQFVPNNSNYTCDLRWSQLNVQSDDICSPKNACFYCIIFKSHILKRRIITFLQHSSIWVVF